ncbi:hypothetical protein DZA65_01395 [Dickeya dianthicola]|uniref:hypothetical protein n=1 Tax=Dickeya dianthicola TaxID=204039 RepID=UPI000CD475B5|nr:hypothetical protein [Dickeya dianthicola]AYC18289.1 hypothetical protein DZA65_01395 [Dickeya dianthicola]MBI0437181.1 hypothetical protein [Dickeya dianthicola]MBI0447754.1 hypothetical protein [Dickeya dianthicola]MBI0452371.1 hypothetical protein [Dickeya dianthicola]MBI0456469.1 hypothetical protein [Dickeya dianthicola]
MMKKTLAILVLALAVPVSALAAEPSVTNSGQSTLQGGGTVAGPSAFNAAKGNGYGFGVGRSVLASALSAATSTNSSTATSTSTVTATRG